MALAAVAVAPALDLLAEPETPCSGGLIWQIENSGSTITYAPLTMEMLDDFLRNFGHLSPREQLFLTGMAVVKHQKI